MLGKRKLDYLARCRGRVDSAKKQRQVDDYDGLWRRLKNLYANKHYDATGLKDEDRIAIGIAFSTINVIAPSVSVSRPRITVASTLAENEDRAVLVQSLVNYLWRRGTLQSEHELAVVDFLIYGFGWMKTGYRFVEEEAKRSQDDVDSDYEQQNAEANSWAQDNAEMAGSAPTEDEIRASIPETELKIVEDTAFAERVSPHDVYVDPEGTTMRNIRWIAQRIVKDIEDVRGNKHYKASARNKTKATGEVSDRYWDASQAKKTDDCKRVVVWEYYDLKAGTMCVFSDGGEDFLVDPTPQPYAFGHPFKMLRNYEVPDQFYPMGELEAIEDLQYELDSTRSAQMNDRRRYKRKYLYDPKAFSRGAIGDLESQRDNVFVRVNEGVELDKAVIPMQQAEMDPQSYQQSEQIQADMNTVSGVNEYARGGSDQNIRRTATEASIIQDAANSRAAYKLSRIETFIADVSKNLIMLMQQYMTVPQVVRVAGANGAPLWFEFERSWIAGEFDFEVEAGSTKPDNEFARKDKALGLMQLLSPMMGSGMINDGELLKHVLREGFGIRDPGKFLSPALTAPQGMGMPMVDPATGMPVAPATAPGVPPTQGQPPVQAPQGFPQ